VNGVLRSRWLWSAVTSNFPPDKQSGGYTELWNAFKRITSGASAAERRALYSGTAARVYRLTVP
jgi:L-fuconolactonase